MLQRAPRSAFAEYQKLLAVREYIQTNRSLFVEGGEINLTDVLAHFNIQEPDYLSLHPSNVITAYNRFVAKRGQLTRRFNNILAERGMYLRKKPNEDAWLLRSNIRVEDRIDRLYATADRTDEIAGTLETGYTDFGNRYSRVPNGVLKRIAARVVAR